MQFYGDLLSEILGESAPSSKSLHLKQNAIEWPMTIVTDDWDAYHNVSTEKVGLPQQKALTLVIATIREWLVNSDAQIRWRRKYDHVRSDEGPQRVKAAPGPSTPKRRMECTKRRHVDSRKVSVSIKTYTKEEFNAYKPWRIARRTLCRGD